MGEPEGPSGLQTTSGQVGGRDDVFPGCGWRDGVESEKIGLGWAVVRRAAAGRRSETATQGRPGYMGTGPWTCPELHPGSRLPRPTLVPPTIEVPRSWDGVELLPNYSVFANIQFP